MRIRNTSTTTWKNYETFVEELFQKELKRSYRENTDSDAILRNASLREVAEQCPTFRAMIDWIGKNTGVPGY